MKVLFHVYTNNESKSCRVLKILHDLSFQYIIQQRNREAQTKLYPQKISVPFTSAIIQIIQNQSTIEVSETI